MLGGGRSSEHEVSLRSAAAVRDGLERAGHEAVAVEVARDGGWTGEGGAVSIEPGGGLLGADVAFPVLHGPFGEDGTVQGLLELADVPYVGAGVLASALAMDKAKAKEVFAHHGIPQAAWRSFRADEVPSDLVDVVGSQLGFPCFTKPSNLGSSVGISKVDEPAQLAAAVEQALRYDEWLVIEEAIVGREIELAVLGNREPRVSVPGEIIAGAEFYDYEDKYHDGRAKLLVPAPLPPDVTARFQALARRAYRAVRAEGMARVDFFYEEEGRARGPLLNEVNTIPGFTPISMYPKMWAASGLPYRQLIDDLVELAIERWRRRRPLHASH